MDFQDTEGVSSLLRLNQHSLRYAISKALKSDEFRHLLLAVVQDMENQSDTKLNGF
jgi:hypothetical protein